MGSADGSITRSFAYCAMGDGRLKGARSQELGSGSLLERANVAVLVYLFICLLASRFLSGDLWPRAMAVQVQQSRRPQAPLTVKNTQQRIPGQQATNKHKQTNKQQTHRAKTVRVHSGLDRSTNDLGKGKLTIMALLRLNVYSSIRNSIRRRLIEGVHTVKWENQSRTIIQLDAFS